MAQVHVIIGEDEYLVSEAAKRIVGDGIGLETVDSANSSNAEAQLKDIREAEASLMTPPFLDPKKTTWWRNVGFLPQGGSQSALNGTVFSHSEENGYGKTVFSIRCDGVFQDCQRNHGAI